MSKKCKNLLLREMNKSEEYIFETTKEECERWFDIINNEIFEGCLPRPDEFDIRWRRKSYAYHLTLRMADGSMKTLLAMSKKYRSKQFFIEVLAHEMVHHWQAVNGKPLGHGPSFLVWKEKFNKRGIPLVKGY